MPSLPCAWYSAPTAEFLATSEETILGALSAGSPRHGLDVTPAQTAAWQSQVDILKRELPGLEDPHSSVFFDFVIPRMGRRIDVVVLLPAAIVVLEFKVGELVSRNTEFSGNRSKLQGRDRPSREHARLCAAECTRGSGAFAQKPGGRRIGRRFLLRRSRALQYGAPYNEGDIRSPLMRFKTFTLSIALIVVGSSAQSQPVAPENTGPNASIVRTVTGKMTFRTLSDGRVRGGEEFRLLVHPDGTRQIFISKDFKAVNAQQTLMARVDARFRPLETYASYWTRDGFKGSMYVTVSGDELTAVAFGPKGRIETALRVPDDISVVHHGEIANGWYYWSGDPRSTAQQTSSVYILNAAPRGDAQVGGFLTQSKFTRLGTEKVTTPAGTFEAVRYRLDGMESLEMWVAGEDRLLVRQTDARNDREYVLTELREGTDLFSSPRK